MTPFNREQRKLERIKESLSPAVEKLKLIKLKKKMMMMMIINSVNGTRVHFTVSIFSNMRDSDVFIVGDAYIFMCLYNSQHTK